MKKIVAVLLTIVYSIGLVSCGQKQEVLCMGLNAEIIDIDIASFTLYVKDVDSEDVVFGEQCALDCKEAMEGKNIIYVNYEVENDVREIQFGDLVIGDTIIISLYESEKEDAKNNVAVVEQVQLATQRIWSR